MIRPAPLFDINESFASPTQRLPKVPRRLGIPHGIFLSMSDPYFCVRFVRQYITNITCSILVIACLIGLITRIVPLTRYAQYDLDAARDTYVYAMMRTGQISPTVHSDRGHDDIGYATVWNGSWPTLGPVIPTGWLPLHLPPLFYYLVFPFTFLGPNPVWAALPDALFSFLSIPLVILITYRLLQGTTRSRRFLLSAVAGLWQSLLFTNIAEGSLAWNPSSVPFFSLSFALVAANIIQRAKVDRYSLLSWGLLGFLLAILVSLHGQTLYTFPFVFVAVCIMFIHRTADLHGKSYALKACTMITLSVLVFASCLTPYWYGESRTHWQNSRAMVGFPVMKTEKISTTDKIRNIMRAYRWLGTEDYFVGLNRTWQTGGLLFLLFLLPTFVKTFRGDRILLSVLICIWIMYFLAITGQSPHDIRFRLLISTMPIFLSISIAAFLNYATLRGRLASYFLAIGVIASMACNFSADTLYMRYRFGPTRFVTVADIIDVFKHIPQGSDVCDLRLWTITPDHYIDEYVTRRNLHLSAACRMGGYAIIPKFVGFAPGMAGMLQDYAPDFNDYEHLPLTYGGMVPGPTVPTNAHIVEQTDALTLVSL
jgi:hypothetical protein